MHKNVKVCVAACLFSLSGIAAAQYPDRTVELIVPYAPGGTTDLIARIVAAKLSDVLAQSVVVVNKPGAGGAVGSAYGARQKPDGYTLVMAVESSHAVNPSVQRKQQYDPVKDFTPISNLVNVPGVLDVNANSDIKTFQQLLDALKADPDKFSFGSSGLGGYSHLFGERFLNETGTEMLHVPYNGLGPALTALLGNQIQVVFDNLPSSTGQIEAGAFRPLAVAAPTRVKSLPDVPTYAEVGYPQLNTPSWFGIAAPANIPTDVLSTLNKAIGETLADPKVIDLIEKQGGIPDHTSPEEFKQLIDESNKRWQGVVQDIGFEKL